MPTDHDTVIAKLGQPRIERLEPALWCELRRWMGEVVR